MGYSITMNCSYYSHSQTTRIPECPEGTNRMWTGYSLLFTQGNGYTHGQDLGRKSVAISKFYYQIDFKYRL